MLSTAHINGEGLLAESVNNHGTFVWSIADDLRAYLTAYRDTLIAAAVTGEIDVDTFDSDRNIEATA